MKKSPLFKNILSVDLATGKHSTEPSVDIAEKYIGGRGANSWIILNETKPFMSPYDPANPLVFGTGPLVGTPVPGACRFNVESLNLFTGGIGSGNAGGHFAPELRFAGYDHILLRGRARRPVYLFIDDGKIQLKDACHLSGKTTWETEDSIKDELGDRKVQIACIGEAGENLVRNACIIAGKSRAIGRCGLGAVMGSKNLKAIAVRGTGSVEVAKPDEFVAFVDRMIDKCFQNEALKMLQNYGTSPFGRPLNDISAWVVRNFQDAYWDQEKLDRAIPEDIESGYMRYRKRHLACFACPIHASNYWEVTEGPYAGTACEGFEANLTLDFGSKLDIDYAPAYIKIHEVCSKLGLDIDNAAGSIAWAFECYEKGILTKDDTDGLELRWGDHGVVVSLLEKMAKREGFGAVIAEGSKRASELMGRGSGQYSIHIKGQDLMEPMRTCKGWALGVAVADRGGTHTRGAPETDFMRTPGDIGEKAWGVPTTDQPNSYEHKPKLVVYFERMHALSDSLGLCNILSSWEGADLPDHNDYARLYSLATGWEISGEEILHIAERIHTVGKLFNMKHAHFTREDDYPPKRLMEEPVKSGPLAGERLAREDWDRMLDEYYALHGWNRKTSYPEPSTLKNLGFQEYSYLLD
jgi:aldehyde:ferredoxin oxidoreductase